MIFRVSAAAAFVLSLVGLSAPLHAQTIEIKLPEVCASLSMPHADQMQGGGNIQCSATIWMRSARQSG